VDNFFIYGFLLFGLGFYILVDSYYTKERSASIFEHIFKFSLIKKALMK